MKHAAIDLATDITALTDVDRQSITAEIISLNGFRCGRVLAVLPTRRPNVWRVSCMQDGAMDALATYDMDVRTGVVSRP
ncbi:MAG: hypothetical protein V7661_07620 [Sulfitobacter sp.]